MLFTSTSMRPSSSSARSAISGAAAGSNRSAATCTTRTPCASASSAVAAERVDAAGVQHEVRALAREVEGDLLADAAARAGDDGDAVAQSELHQPSVATRSAYAMGSSSMS